MTSTALCRITEFVDDSAPSDEGAVSAADWGRDKGLSSKTDGIPEDKCGGEYKPADIAACPPI